MENEKKTQLPQEDPAAELTAQIPQEELSEADKEAQLWLEELLAATAPEAKEPAAETVPEQSADIDAPQAAPVEESAPQEPDWFLELEAPAEQVQHIGTDEQAVSQHDMPELADMELEKIMQEAMSDDWNIDAIEKEIMAQVDQEIYSGDTADSGSEEAEYADSEATQENDLIDSRRKVRPKRKNGYGLLGLPHLASMLVWLVLCVAIGTSFGRILWLCAADVLAFGRQDQEVVVTITADDDLDDIADKLQSAGLIQYKDLFKLYANLTGAVEDGDISTGTFTLNTLYDYHALVKHMRPSSSARQTTTVTIPEGYTCAQIFALLEEEGVCTVAELEEYCTQSEFSSYWFLENVEKGTKYCLEGFLFPDTYEFYTDSSAKQVFIKLLDGFDNHFSEDMQVQLQQLNTLLEGMYAKNGASASYVPLTLFDVITVASMIEKETAYSGESPTIASVIYNRLSNPANYPYLDIDATIIYAQGGIADKIDTSLDHPYNTYKYKGLPPGPISNPGDNSLKAALNPESTGYHFYALDPTEEVLSHKFFKTYKEQEAFLNSLR